MTEREPLWTHDSATVYYYDDRDATDPVRSENVKVELYPNWVRMRTPADSWIPRELVEKVLTV